MPAEYPHHSDDSYMHNMTPVQSFVDPPHEVTEEERNRPRYGRPIRKSTIGRSPSPNVDGQSAPPVEGK